MEYVSDSDVLEYQNESMSVPLQIWTSLGARESIEYWRIADIIPVLQFRF